MARALLLSALVTASAWSSAQSPAVLFTNVAGNPGSSVPGFPSESWQLGTSFGAAFDRPYVSATGDRWAVVGTTENGTVDLDLLVVGQGLGAPTGVVREGAPSFLDPARNYGFLRMMVGINSAGMVAWNGDLAGSTTDDDYVAAGTPPAFSVVAREGTLNPATGVNNGSTLNNVHLLEDGTVRYRQTNAGGTFVAMISGTTALVQAGITTPSGQLATPVPLSSVGSDRFYSDANGSNTIYVGVPTGTGGANLEMTVMNNRVLVQETFPIPGYSITTPVRFITADTGNVGISPSNGNFFFRASLDTGTTGVTIDDAVAFGTLVGGTPTALTFFKTNDPITPGNSETWSDDVGSSSTFSNSKINSYGDTVVCGNTSNPDAFRDEVLVFNGNRVLFREGQPIDLNGNGLFDDGAVLGFFGTDDFVLTDTNIGYAIITVRSSTAATATTMLGSAFVRFVLPLTGDVNNDGEVGPADFSEVLSGFGSETGDAGYTNDPFGNCRDQDNNGEIGPADFSVVLANFGRER